MYLGLCMEPRPCRLAVKRSRFNLRVHQESTRTLPNRLVLEHRHHLVKQSHHFGLTTIDRRRRWERADLQTHLRIDRQHSPLSRLKNTCSKGPRQERLSRCSPMLAPRFEPQPSLSTIAVETKLEVVPTCVSHKTYSNSISLLPTSYRRFQHT
jgi:hypothetical protein